jgi:large subunit ribosomal protein L25
MAQFISITATPRVTGGKGAARQTRLNKKVPAVIYGHGRASQSLEVDAQALEQALSGHEPSSTLVDLTVDGKKARALIREIQRHPVRPDIIHIDFYEIHADEKVTLKVPVHLTGTPDGVRNAGGVLDQVTREVEIEVLPEHIPDRVELDVTTLTIGRSVHVSDLVIPNATMLTQSDLTIATVVPPRAEEVAAPTAETGAEVAEPELIRKVREDEEGEGAAGEAEGKAPEATPAKPEKSKGGKEG